MTDYELTRRDAIAALSAAGISATASSLTWDAVDPGDQSDGPTLSDHDRELLDAVATVVYPSEVSGVSSFVETYVVGRVRADEGRLEGLVDALDFLDSYAKEWYDAGYLELSPERRETALSAIGVDVSDPDPEGSDPARLRFYVVNELLYALYASPTGGELLDLENPQGHPGGTDTYQQGP